MPIVFRSVVLIVACLLGTACLAAAMLGFMLAQQSGAVEIAGVRIEETR